MADTSLDIIINTIAAGNGAQISKDNLKALGQELETINAKQGSATQMDRQRAAEIQRVAEALKQQRLETEKATAAARELQNAGGKGGGGHGGGSSFGLNPVMMEHFGTIVGQQVGVSGLGTAFLSGGAAGSALMLVLAGLHAGFEKLSEDMESVHQLSDTLKDRGLFSADYMARVTGLAEGLKDNSHSTKDWMEALTELHRFGADEKIIRPLAEHTQQLAKIMGGDLKSATAIAKAELQGNFQVLESLGVVTDSTKTHTEQLADAFNQLGMTGPENFRAIQEAAANAKAGIIDLKQEAKDTAEAFKKAADAIERLRALHEKARHEKEDVKKAEVEAQVAEGKMTPEAGEKELARIKADSVKATYEADQVARRAKITESGQAIGENQNTIAETGADLGERHRIVDVLSRAGGVNEDDLKKFARLRELLAQLEGGTISGGGVTEMGSLEHGPTGARLRDQFGPNLRSEEANKNFQDRSQAFGETGTLPVGRRNLPAEQKALNELEPGLIAEQNAAYKRINEHMERIAKLEQEMTEAENSFGATMKKLGAEDRKKAAGKWGSDEDIDQAFDWTKPRQLFNPGRNIDQRSVERWDTEPGPRLDQFNEIQRDKRQRGAEDEFNRRQQPQERSGSEPDMGALGDVTESASGLTASIESFAEQSVALHEATADKLDQLAEKISNLTSRHNDSFA